jgi:predicted GH43/DUF377 family glycosyl hydrolase
MHMLTRSAANPILLPNGSNEWEKKAAFNGSVVKQNGQFHMVYRALSNPTYYQGHNLELSTVGYAVSNDGIHFTDHKQLVKPEYLWELYGCEDPRITFFNGMYYIFYTALSNYPFNADGIKVGVATTSDMKTIEEKHLVTPFNAKAMALFPEKVDGKIAVIVAANTDRPPSKIAIALVDREEELWDETFWHNWYAYVDDHTLPLLRTPSDQVEVGAVPVKTDNGWLLIYSYIKDYYTDQKIFGIEAALLDLNNPRKVIARTKGPLLVPETPYEKYGEVNNIAFPSGAVIHEEKLFVYYGAADTSTCVAYGNLNEILEEMEYLDKPPVRSLPAGAVTMERFDENPVLMPLPEHSWEDKAVFNPAAFYENDKVHIVYRAMSNNNLSSFGYATSIDGYHIDERHPDPIYIPREIFERNAHSEGNSGCEDPRITRIEERYYMLYTAYDGEHPPRVAMSSIAIDDFRQQKWHWAIPKLISPPDIDDKDAAIFPKKIKGKYYILHRLQSSIWIDTVDDLHFYEGNYLGGKILFQPRPDNWDRIRIGISSPPIETEKGWLLLYHGITENHEYMLGASLLGLHDPTEVISRLDYPILTPDMHYERDGQIPNVVFPCGAVVKDDTLFVYYGGADSVLCVATIPMEKLLSALLKK